MIDGERLRLLLAELRARAQVTTDQRCHFGMRPALGTTHPDALVPRVCSPSQVHSRPSRVEPRRREQPVRTRSLERFASLYRKLRAIAVREAFSSARRKSSFFPTNASGPEGMRESSPRPKRSDWPKSAPPLTARLDEQRASLQAGPRLVQACFAPSPGPRPGTTRSGSPGSSPCPGSGSPGPGPPSAAPRWSICSTCTVAVERRLNRPVRVEPRIERAHEPPVHQQQSDVAVGDLGDVDVAVAGHRERRVRARPGEQPSDRLRNLRVGAEVHALDPHVRRVLPVVPAAARRSTPARTPST